MFNSFVISGNKFHCMSVCGSLTFALHTNLGLRLFTAYSLAGKGDAAKLLFEAELLSQIMVTTNWCFI